MYNKEDERCYREIVYDINELAGLIGKAGDKYFDRIIENLNKIIENRPGVQKTSTNK